MAFFKKMKNFGEIIFENDYITVNYSIHHLNQCKIIILSLEINLLYNPRSTIPSFYFFYIELELRNLEIHFLNVFLKQAFHII
jgi:hypothetical protein